MDVEIINQTSKVIYCLPETELRMSWDDALFDWLPDPKETERTFRILVENVTGPVNVLRLRTSLYCFPGGAQLSISP